MRIKLTPELEAYCAEHKIRVTDGMELDDAQLEKAREMWSRQHPDKDAEEIEIHAIGLVAAQIKPDVARVDEPFRTPAATARDWKEIAWKIAVLILLLLITIRGHAQIDVIKVQDNAGAAVGTIAAPFTFKAGANCTWAKAASTYTFNCAGGAAGAGGLNTQVQWNSTGSLAGISSLTTDGTITTALAGADWLFADLTTPTKKFQFDASNISAVTTRTMNVPDANATFAQAIAAVSHKFITQMSAQGLFTLAQPACADISDAGVFCAGTAYSSLTGIPSTFAPSGHNILSSAHSDTTAASAVRGDGFFAIGATPTWQRLAHPSTSGGYFKWNGTDIVASSLAASGTGTPTACTNQFVTGFTLNADAAPTSTCTTDTLASAQHANQGTTTTVLHGNAAGNPAFGSVTTSDLSSTTGNGTQVATGTGTYTSGNCVKIDANGNLIDNGSACGGAGGTFNPLDATTLWLRDDFAGFGANSNQPFGNLGWSIGAIGGGSTGASDVAAGVYPHLGLYRLQPDGTTAHGVALSLAEGSAGFRQPFGDMATNTNWDSYWIFQLSQTTNEKVYIGFVNDWSVDPPNGMYLRYSTTLADTNFTFVTQSGGSATTSVTNSIAANTTYNCVRIRSTVAGTIKFSIGATCASLGTETSLSTNVPTAVITPAWILTQTTTATAPQMFADFMAVQFTSLSR